MTVRVMLLGPDASVRGIESALEGDAEIEIVERAESVDETLKVAREARPDVLVTWLRTVGVDGLDLLERLTREADTAPPATVLIGRDEPIAQYVTAVTLGARALLTERVGSDTLQQAVRAAAAGNAYLGPTTTAEVFTYLRGIHGLVDPPGGDVRPAALELLTERERDILEALADGESNDEIAGRLTLSSATVKSGISRLLTKLGVTSRLQAGLVGYRWRGHLRSRVPQLK